MSHQPQPVIDNPDELTDSIMAHLPDVGVTKEKAHGKRWIYIASAIAVAASLLLLLVFHQGREETEPPPTPPRGRVAKITEPPSVPLQLPQKRERATPPVPPKRERTAPPVPPKRRVAKMTEPSSVPPTPQKERIARESDFSLPPGGDGGGIVRPAVEDPYLMMARQAQDIRSRGERLHEEVAMLMDD
ncbi:MAG: hypothetical protein J6T52_02990 [Bacteroidaceae bacterium]|nr:hypothetical protein [Bacteroidaceae bacterium]